MFFPNRAWPVACLVMINRQISYACTSNPGALPEVCRILRQFSPGDQPTVALKAFLLGEERNRYQDSPILVRAWINRRSGFLMIRSLTLICLSIFVLSSATVTHARDRWVRIARHTADLRQDLETIDLSKVKGSFKAFRVRALRRPVKFESVRFGYSDGTGYVSKQPFRLRPGERTKEIDRTGLERFVDEVVVDYAPQRRSRRRPVLEIWGLQSRTGRLAKRKKNVGGGRYITAARQSAGADKKEEEYKGPPLPDRATIGSPGSNGDVLFGAKYVGFGVDTDVIRVGRKIGKFENIWLQVLDNDIFMQDLKVVYEDGTSKTYPINATFTKMTRSERFDLDGSQFVKEIELSYRSKPGFEGQARIEVFGEHANGWLGPDGEGRKFNDGWVLLGARTAGFIGFDRDVIPVGTNEGGFKEIRVAVRERAITLSQVKVVYGNGDEDIIPVKTRVDAGSTYGPIGLRSEGSQIREIQARYRSRFIDRAAAGKGNAIVEIWARH